jgi:hypothetical protein
MWLGLYEEDKEDPAFVVRCVSKFTPSCFQSHNITLLIPAKCFTIGTYSRCLRELEHPEWVVEGYFHEVKIIHTKRGHKKEEDDEREEVIFFYGKVATLPWDPDRWR